MMKINYYFEGFYYRRKFNMINQGKNNLKIFLDLEESLYNF